MTRSIVVRRGLALGDVSLAFVAMHLAFRGFKRFTSWGRLESETGVNLSPGVVMIAMAVALIALRRWCAPASRNGRATFTATVASHGLTPRPFLRSVNAAFLCMLILAATGLLFRACGAPITRLPISGSVGISLACVYVVATIALLLALKAWGTRIDRMPRIIGLALLIAIPATPIVIALATHRPIGREAVTLLWLLVGAGIGEEVFFRGYMQSRLNQVFGRPWRVLGVPFGPGLLIAAAFFGLVHALNTADYFTGAYRFAWWHGLATCAALYSGFLREQTGSVLAPAIVHGYSDVVIRLPGLI